MALVDGMTTDAEVWRAVGLSRAGLGRFLKTAQEAVGLQGEVQVLLAGDATLKRLNREFRGKNKVTDVLSFPAVPGMGYGGDLAISLETAGRQAEEHGHGLRDEVRVLLLHGLLHLSGMDHEVDGGDMAAREAELRRVLGLKSGLIARVEGGARYASEKQVPRVARNGRKKSNGNSHGNSNGNGSSNSNSNGNSNGNGNGSSNSNSNGNSHGNGTKSGKGNSANRGNGTRKRPVGVGA
jgi:probable rRNA maturation factor